MRLRGLTLSVRHYSYECKAPTQERPYVSRPSRSQQLRNPKLVPKLTSDTPNPLEKKKGIADEELAKLEAERERKRELEERAEDQSLLIQSQPSQQMPQEILALHHLSGELGLLLLSDEMTVPTPRVIAVTAEAHRPHDDSGIQYHAIVDLLLARIFREVIGLNQDRSLMAEEMTPRPLGNGVTRSQEGATAIGGVSRSRARGHHSEMTGHIEGEMITTRRVADVVVVAMKDREGCLLERRPESEV
ncbi:hypothetical protein ACHAQJ_008688 [Trichoderma viride]